MYLAQLLILASVLIEISLSSLGYFVVLYPPQKIAQRATCHIETTSVHTQK